MPNLVGFATLRKSRFVSDMLVTMGRLPHGPPCSDAGAEATSRTRRAAARAGVMKVLFSTMMISRSFAEAVVSRFCRFHIVNSLLTAVRKPGWTYHLRDHYRCANQTMFPARENRRSSI